MTLERITILENKGGVPIYFHDQSYTILGQNFAEGNDVCDGIFIDGGSGCIRFQSTSDQATSSIEATTITIPSPTPKTTAPRGGTGYFNYDFEDLEYGPNRGWGEVRQNPEQLRYQELIGTLKRSLINKCDWKNVNQSPIDLCENKINKDCYEYHQIRTHVRISGVYQAT